MCIKHVDTILRANCLLGAEFNVGMVQVYIKEMKKSLKAKIVVAFPVHVLLLHFAMVYRPLFNDA